MGKVFKGLIIAFCCIIISISLVFAKAEEMENRYAPIIYLDSKEKSPLTSVEKFLEMGISLEAHGLLDKSITLRKKVNIRDLAKFTTKKIKIGGKELPLALDTGETTSEYVPVVYYHTINKDKYTYIQYWFFYAYNDTSWINPNQIIQQCGNHEGDWEHISIKINDKKYLSAISENDYYQAIEELYFAQHNIGDNDFRKFKKRNDSSIHFEGTHVKAYVARGTHATYSEPDDGKGYLLADIAGIKLYDFTDGKGIRLESSGHLVNLDDQDWNKFGGRWGKISDDICNLAESVSKISNDGPTSTMYRPYYYNTDWQIKGSER